MDKMSLDKLISEMLCFLKRGGSFGIQHLAVMQEKGDFVDKPGKAARSFLVNKKCPDCRFNHPFRLRAWDA